TGAPGPASLAGGAGARPDHPISRHRPDGNPADPRGAAPASHPRAGSSWSKIVEPGGPFTCWSAGVSLISEDAMRPRIAKGQQGVFGSDIQGIFVMENTDSLFSRTSSRIGPR